LGERRCLERGVKRREGFCVVGVCVCGGALVLCCSEAGLWTHTKSTYLITPNQLEAVCIYRLSISYDEKYGREQEWHELT
jgi:hypothetical protein